ncbi:aldo/keto reductase [Clostridium baratii]|uniref:aldo/keto reductase n=1 Tax=Clostridium baratii TaxID=1561 RepID=UPI0036F1B2AD
MEKSILSNNIAIPKLGFGTYLIKEEREIESSLSWAYKAGYRRIDTASYYKNEEYIGKAIKNLNIHREQLFITSKVWNSQQGYDSTLRAFEESLLKLKVDYLDSYLIHWPKPNLNDTWKALEYLYEQGLVRSIGVCNFTEEYIEKIKRYCNVIPMINQIECHPYLQQEALRNYCKSNGIIVEAWGPLMQGKIFDMEEMKILSEKYNKSISQISLRWLIQSDMLAIPKSTNKRRIFENIDIFNFQISYDDMNYIKYNLSKDIRVGPKPNYIYNKL